MLSSMYQSSHSQPTLTSPKADHGVLSTCTMPPSDLYVSPATAATEADTIMALLTGKDTEGLCGHREEGEGPALLRLRQK